MIRYYDKIFLPLAILIVSLTFSMIGFLGIPEYQLSFSSFSKNFFYSSTIILIFRGFISFLDLKLPWDKALSKRFVLQLVCSLIAYVSIQSLILFVIEKSELTLMVILTFIIGTLSVLILNILYLLMYLKVKKISIAQEEKEKGRQLQATFIRGSKNGRPIDIKQQDIFYVQLNQGVTKLIKTNNETLIMQESLSDLEALLEKSRFFRANRQYIISKDSIDSVVYNSNKSCSVTLKENAIAPITISRHKSPSFKKWLKTSVLNMESDLKDAL